MKHYWIILKKYKSSLLISPLLVLITVICETIQPYFMSRIVDEGIIPKEIEIITQVGIIMVIVSIVGLIISIVNVYISSKASIGFGTDLRATLFNKIQTFAFPDIDRFSTASLITRLTNDITKIQQVILMSMRILMRAPLMLIMALFFIIHINSELAFILAVAIPMLAICVFIIMRKGFPFFIKVQQKIDMLNGIVRENLINMRVVKSFVREDFETTKFTHSSEDLRDTVIKASNIIIAIFPAMQLVLNMSVLAILWFGGVKVMEGNLKVGELISFVNYLMQVLMALMMLSMVFMTIARASASSQRILEVLNSDSSLNDISIALIKDFKIRSGNVEFRNVCFRYAEGETDVLKNINFHVQTGETIAVVGATGSAKSSMMQLIPRLYDATEGEILIDGINVRDYKLDVLHQKVGMVLQKNDLFTGTILDNLKWGKPDATFEEVEEAAKAAQAHGFIMSFEKGYDTVLGRGGVNVSGGQKQRLCIARTLLRKPKILILDDSTSAVDSETEIKIKNNLDRILKDTTVFIVTQRINTMQSADRVIVLEDGEIEAFGTSDELIHTSAVCQEIHNSQQLIMD